MTISERNVHKQPILFDIDIIVTSTYLAQTTAINGSSSGVCHEPPPVDV